MPDSSLHDLIIIGGGPGGYTAGIYAQRAALKTVLIEKGIPGGQLNNTDEVENWPGTEKISGADLAIQFSQHAAAYDLAVLNREVVGIEPGRNHHTILLDNGEKLTSHAVILATGGSPKKLGIPGEDQNYGRGVSYCAVCDGFFFRNKTVVVVGGGDSALEESLYLAKLAKRVYIAHRRDAFRAGMILQKRVLHEERITVLWNTVLTEIQADAQGVNGVITRNTMDGTTSALATDGVFVFIGFEPNNGLVPAGTKMNANGYVIADEKCETNTPGIFVVGDLKEKYAKQIVTAAADGCTAALAAAHYVENKKSGA
ncbi:thioredoxin-disulfide reductase [Thiovibrio frasassiensis]|jgi:thioredoxin reductase (NADPH)|uniref:Thioredoxin reductase n=1 Tax=Thiovibrio frasassiensis TaxID=2984131 RepID=A0A9X4RR37_9BACT|nr:thioredoxin-disulfide reductase [Thiovibrio frasassiensis]MDG4476917.1 thioredoxin-disulfide reductase [Thiovibrio frasassiensis]